MSKALHQSSVTYFSNNELITYYHKHTSRIGADNRIYYILVPRASGIIETYCTTFNTGLDGNIVDDMLKGELTVLYVVLAEGLFQEQEFKTRIS